MNQRIFALTLCLTLAWAVPVGGEAVQTTYVACYGIAEFKLTHSSERVYATLTMKPLAAPFPITAEEAHTLWRLHLTEDLIVDDIFYTRSSSKFLDKTGCTVRKSAVTARLEVARMLKERSKTGRFYRGVRSEHDWLNNL